jgi:glycosyltransferase involved in cell wall biosynthesis
VPDRLSILVPAYNERSTIAAVLDRLMAIDLPIPREVIVIDDGSTDGTRQVLEEVRARIPEIVSVSAASNRGKGHAIRTGLAKATGTIVAIQDADLELNPAQLGELVGPILRQETSVVYGSRFLDGRGETPWLSYAANRVLTFATNRLFGASLTDMETCYKVMRTSVARALVLEADRFDIEPEITARLLQAGHRIVERPIAFSPRSRAAGKKIGWSDGVAALRTLVRCRRTRPTRPVA